MKNLAGSLPKSKMAAFFNLPSSIKWRLSKTSSGVSFSDSTGIRSASTAFRKKYFIAFGSISSRVARSLMRSSHERPIFLRMKCWSAAPLSSCLVEPDR